MRGRPVRWPALRSDTRLAERQATAPPDLVTKGVRWVPAVREGWQGWGRRRLKVLRRLQPGGRVAVRFEVLRGLAARFLPRPGPGPPGWMIRVRVWSRRGVFGGVRGPLALGPFVARRHWGPGARGELRSRGWGRPPEPRPARQTGQVLPSAAGHAVPSTRERHPPI
jgi:hypothetical protein